MRTQCATTDYQCNRHTPVDIYTYTYLQNDHHEPFLRQDVSCPPGWGDLDAG